MDIRRFATAGAILAAIGYQAAAAQLPTLAECDRLQLSMLEQGQCLDRTYAEADAELNRVYQVALKGMDSTQRNVLRSAQRAWLRQRDADVRAIYSLTGGNHPSIMARPVEILLIRQRVAFLQALAGELRTVHY